MITSPYRYSRFVQCLPVVPAIIRFMIVLSHCCSSNVQHHKRFWQASSLEACTHIQQHKHTEHSTLGTSGTVTCQLRSSKKGLTLPACWWPSHLRACTGAVRGSPGTSSFNVKSQSTMFSPPANISILTQFWNVVCSQLRGYGIESGPM